MGQGILLLILLPLILLGGLAAVVFGIVYAIVNKRPGVAVASIVVPIVLVIGAGTLFLFVGLATRYAAIRSDFGGDPNLVALSQPTFPDSAVPGMPAAPSIPAVETWKPPMPPGYRNQSNQEPWTKAPTMPSMPPMPAMPAFPSAPQIHLNGLATPSWVRLAVVLLVCLVVAKLVSKGASRDGQRRRGWGKIVVAAVLIIVALNLVALRVSYAPHRVVQAEKDARNQAWVATQIHNRVEADPNAQQVADEVAQKAGGLNEQSIQEIWEKLNQPRIKLDGDQPTAKLAVNSGASEIAVVAPPESAAKPAAKISKKTPEALDQSLDRLERMVEQVTAVADRISDAGTLIGKGMIALSDTAASRPRAVSGESATASEAAEASTPMAEAAPAVYVAAGDAPIRSRQTIEIEFDQQKLSQYVQSYAKIKDLLGRDGFWRGASVRFVPNESRILVTGELADDFVARLSGTLVDTVGRQRRPIHLSDVATITTSADRIAQETATSTSTNSLRPAWVDEAPKNIGNVRRQVIVAGDFVTVDECNREADQQLYLVTLNHLKELCGDAELDRISVPMVKLNNGRLQPSASEYAARTFAKSTLNLMGVGIDFIRREIAKKEYVETVERSVGPMKQLYVQVEFSPSIDQELRQRWDELRRQNRFAIVGVGAGSLLGLMGLVFGLLKVDTWTKGYYTKRLFFGVPAAIIGLVGLLIVLNA
jgi:hypothetical protein